MDALSSTSTCHVHSGIGGSLSHKPSTVDCPSVYLPILKSPMNFPTIPSGIQSIQRSICHHCPTAQLPRQPIDWNGNLGGLKLIGFACTEEMGVKANVRLAWIGCLGFVKPIMHAAQKTPRSFSPSALSRIALVMESNVIPLHAPG